MGGRAKSIPHSSCIISLSARHFSYGGTSMSGGSNYQTLRESHFKQNHFPTFANFSQFLVIFSFYFCLCESTVAFPHTGQISPSTERKASGDVALTHEGGLIYVCHSGEPPLIKWNPLDEPSHPSGPSQSIFWRLFLPVTLGLIRYRRRWSRGWRCLIEKQQTSSFLFSPFHVFQRTRPLYRMSRTSIDCPPSRCLKQSVALREEHL